MFDQDAECRSDPEDQPQGTVAHLAELPDGCGCAEVWEHLSGRRE